VFAAVRLVWAWPVDHAPAAAARALAARGISLLTGQCRFEQSHLSSGLQCYAFVNVCTPQCVHWIGAALFAVLERI
jgi:hypothetical protein